MTLTATSQNDRSRETGRAALWMIGAVASFSLMAVSGREAGRTFSMPTAELLTWRSVIGIAVVLAVMAATGRLGDMRTARLGLHALRNVGHFFGQYCWYYAVTIIPLAQLFALEFTAPIWVALFAPLLLGERFSWLRLGAIGVSFVGVLLVVKVWSEGFAAGFSSGQIWGLMAALGFASQMVVTKRLTATDSTLCVVFWMVVMQAPMGVLVAGGLPAWPPGAMAWFWTILLSLGGLSAHFCLTQAFRHADATVVTPMDFARLPVIAVVGALAYSEPLVWNVLAGGALIFLGNYINVRFVRQP